MIGALCTIFSTGISATAMGVFILEQLKFYENDILFFVLFILANFQTVLSTMLYTQTSAHAKTIFLSENMKHNTRANKRIWCCSLTFSL